MILFHRHPQVPPDQPGDTLPPPLTWDYARHFDGEPAFFASDLALCTCANGHTCRMVATIYSIAADGTVSPSYVCPSCSFHDFVQLVGWTAP